MADITERYSDDEWMELWRKEIQKMIADNDKPATKTSQEVTPKLVQITPVAAADARAKASLDQHDVVTLTKRKRTNVLTQRKRARKGTRSDVFD